MIIGIDANEANQKVRVGVGQYALNIIKALARLDHKNQYFLYLKDSPLPELPPSSKNWHYIVTGPRPLWTKIALPLQLFFGGRHLDLFYSPGHYLPLLSPFPCIPTIHDIGYLQYQKQFTAKDLYQLIHWTEASLRQARHIIAVSQFTKTELVNTYHLNPASISLVYNGVRPKPVLNKPDSAKILRKFKIRQPYFLSVGTLKPNKNYPFLIKTFAAFLKQQDPKSPKYQLVIAGKKGWLFDNIYHSVTKNHLESQVIFTDFISETEKWHLYQNAKALIIPSLYEGFGIPAIESQMVGTPVLASRIPSLQEVLGTSAIYFNPKSSASLLRVMNEINRKNPSKLFINRAQKQASKFSWENSAQELIAVFQLFNPSKTV